LRWLVVLTACALAVTPAAADPRIRLGAKLWSAFLCSQYADGAWNEKERDRLLALGLNAGREFVGAYLRNEIQYKQMIEEVPFHVTTQLKGPSVDFILGKIYQSASEWAMMQRIADKVDIKYTKQWSEQKFKTSNCSFLQ